MTTISAKIIADSVSPQGIRLTTMQLHYPRMIHSEFMTHRVFGRNARSSRAVPVEKMIQEVIDDPVIPIHWGAAQKGMQAYEETSELVSVPGCGGTLFNDGSYVSGKVTREEAWLKARDYVVSVAKAYHEAGYAKQVINRLLEPWLHIDTLVTATEWSNFFVLRDHHAAEPHIRALAQEMKRVMADSSPQILDYGVWHLPYILDAEHDEFSTSDLLKLSVARCARISYTPFDGNGSIESELKRYELLVGSHPMHASPAEHQAKPDEVHTYAGNTPIWRTPQWHGNLKGWIQFRKTLPGECQ
jgi:hypothetical protein